MSKGGIENKHARVANSLGIDSDTMKNHPYDLEVGKSGPLLVHGMSKHPMKSFGKVGWDHTQHTFGQEMTLVLGFL